MAKKKSAQSEHEVGTSAYFTDQATYYRTLHKEALKHCVEFGGLAGLLGGIAVMSLAETPELGGWGLFVGGIAGLSAYIPADLAKASIQDATRHSESIAHYSLRAEQANNNEL